MTSGPVLLGTGSREYEDTATLEAWADAVHADWNTPLLVVHGWARGFDQALDSWAVRHRAQGVQVRRFKADWKGPAGLRAGADRNTAMVQALAGIEQRMALIGLHPGADNHGTLDCAEKILNADIPWEAWWGATALTPSRPVARHELEALIAEAERVKAKRRAAKRKAARDRWMKALNV